MKKDIVKFIVWALTNDTDLEYRGFDTEDEANKYLANIEHKENTEYSISKEIVNAPYFEMMYGEYA